MGLRVFFCLMVFAAFAPSPLLANPICSTILFSTKTFKFNTGRNKGRLMSYRIDKPLNWNGKTVVLNQGFTRNMRFWDKHVAYLLKRGFQVFRYDAFNIGLTLALNGVLKTESGYGFRDNTHAVTKILEKERIESNIYVVGHSLGAAHAVLLTNMLNFKFSHREENGLKSVVEKTLIASPYITHLEDYYISETTDLISSPFKVPNFWSSLDKNPVSSFFNNSVEAYNEGLNLFFGIGVSTMTDLNSETAIDFVIEEGLRDRTPAEETGLDLDVEKRGLLQILDSTRSIDILKSIEHLASDIELLSGNKEGALVPDSLLEDLKAIAPVGMSHTLIESDHMTPYSPEFYEWLENHLN